MIARKMIPCFLQEFNLTGSTQLYFLEFSLLFYIKKIMIYHSNIVGISLIDNSSLALL